MIVLAIGAVSISGYVQAPDITPTVDPPKEDITPTVDPVELFELLELPEEATTIKLISPKDGEEVDNLTPRFEWTPIGLPEVTYTLKIWLLPAYIIGKMKGYGLIENEEAFRNFFVETIKNYLVFTKEGIEGTSFSYIKDMYNPFISGLTYVWQVIAYKGDSLIEASNEVWTFTVTEDMGAIEEVHPSLISTIDDTTTKTECNELKTTKLTLEWQDVIKDDDWPFDEVLANITQSISITLHPPSCQPKISNNETQVANYIFDITPTFKDNDPQDDEYILV